LSLLLEFGLPALEVPVIEKSCYLKDAIDKNGQLVLLSAKQGR